MWQPVPLVYEFVWILLNTLGETRNVNIVKEKKRINELFWRYIFWIAEGLALCSQTIKALTLIDRLFKELCLTLFYFITHEALELIAFFIGSRGR